MMKSTGDVTVIVASTKIYFRNIMKSQKINGIITLSILCGILSKLCGLSSRRSPDTIINSNAPDRESDEYNSP